MSILHKDHKTDESEIKFRFLSDSVLKAFEEDIAILDFGFWIREFSICDRSKLRVSIGTVGGPAICENPKPALPNVLACRVSDD